MRSQEVESGTWWSHVPAEWSYRTPSPSRESAGVRVGRDGGVHSISSFGATAVYHGTVYKYIISLEHTTPRARPPNHNMEPQSKNIDVNERKAKLSSCELEDQRDIYGQEGARGAEPHASAGSRTGSPRCAAMCDEHVISGRIILATLCPCRRVGWRWAAARPRCCRQKRCANARARRTRRSSCGRDRCRGQSQTT